MAYKLTRYEMETTVNYNAEEKTAILYTRDKAVMRKLDKLVEKCPETYKCIRETSIDKTYEFPKRLLSFRTPRVLTDEQREKIRERFMQSRGKGDELEEELMEELLNEEIEEDDEDYGDDDSCSDETEGDTGVGDDDAEDKADSL